jgi:hypothetical protein
VRELKRGANVAEQGRAGVEGFNLGSNLESGF